MTFYEDEERKIDFDAVNHPAHYTDGQIEVIDFIEDKGFIEGFCKGNAIKYISRAGKKHSNGVSDIDKEIQDLEKAVWYLNHYIDILKESKWNESN